MHPFLNFPWLLPPIICKTRQASRSLFPATPPPPSFAYRQNASSSFSPSALPPRLPDFHSDHLLRVALGRLAARPKGLPSAKCTAMASPIWTPASYLHYSLLPPTSSTLCSSRLPPVNAPWLPVVLIPWWSLCTLVLWDSTPIRSTPLRWCFLLLCYSVNGQSPQLGVQHPGPNTIVTVTLGKGFSLSRMSDTTQLDAGWEDREITRGAGELSAGTE